MSSKIFITGSADGLGQMAASLLVQQGHQVILHARNEKRGQDAMAAVPGARAVVVGDLSSIAETRSVAEQVNALGQCDAVIYNAGLGFREPYTQTIDGLPQLFAVNALAPYILTALIKRPKRLVYISSGMHRRAKLNLDDILWKTREWNGSEAYAETKLLNVLLTFAIARRWKNVYSNSVTPGWVATKMGGADAPDDIKAAPETQVWLATSNDSAAKVSGQYFYHLEPHPPHKQANDHDAQDKFIKNCEQISSVAFPS